MDGIGALVFDDSLQWSQRLSCEGSKELFVLLNGCINKLSDDVAEQGSIGLAELLDVKLIAIEGLYLLVVFLRNYFAKLVEEDVLSLRDVFSLHPNEL